MVNWNNVISKCNTYANLGCTKSVKSLSSERVLWTHSVCCVASSSIPGGWWLILSEHRTTLKAGDVVMYCADDMVVWSFHITWPPERHGDSHPASSNRCWRKKALDAQFWMTDIMENTKTNGDVENKLWTSSWMNCIHVLSFLANLGNLEMLFVAWVYVSWCLNWQFIVNHVHLPTPRSEWCWLHWHELLQVYPIPPEEIDIWPFLRQSWYHLLLFI